MFVEPIDRANSEKSEDCFLMNCHLSGTVKMLLLTQKAHHGPIKVEFSTSANRFAPGLCLTLDDLRNDDWYSR
jgi:hypothetical protein